MEKYHIKKMRHRRQISPAPADFGGQGSSGRANGLKTKKRRLLLLGQDFKISSNPAIDDFERLKIASDDSATFPVVLAYLSI